ncbi:putative bifunctional diguanylate cyclase/phosphodiesterase [Methylobacterium sp. A49B]|uniref:GGDEF and EAL domain-containing protein n=1 Tax=Methylobacterium mesophilicum SR1.6/6 TaxID=908290 RepID=A0A6B9FN48_9HYPH|nr:GGDEF and EAL domain-containing protein [Methylobacterium mesophilicum]QGY02505.1 GGDEF and EAL domain-containing protein [Methylobacterium mesophilicum SR1.6/6]
MVPGLSELLDKELSRPWYARTGSTVRQLYEADRESWRRRSARIAAHVAGLVYVIFAVTDFVLVRDVFVPNLIARLAIALLFVLGTEGLFRRGARSLLIEAHCASATVLAYVAWLQISDLSVHQVNMSYYAAYGVIFMTGQNVFFKFRFTVAAVSSGAILLVSQVDLLQHRYVSLEYVVAYSSLFLSMYTLTLYVNWRLNQERYLVFINSARAEIRQNEAVERGAALLRLSTTDALTGLANRRAVDEELRAYWRDWQMQQTSFAVILVDVDYFKIYNDFYGHQEGDLCLVAVAEAMAQVSAPDGHMVGRFGGEEFIVVAPARDREQVRQISEHLRRAVEDLKIAHEQRPDQFCVVTVSVGAAFSQDIPGTRVESLITGADRALYEAKRSDRNCVRVFDQDEADRLDSDESLADLLRTAQSRDLVSLVYQPVIEAVSGTIVGAEALMRLATPGGKVVSPAVFIPLAERMGIIGKLGFWAIRTACRDLLAENVVPLVSVNVSPIQLKAPGFALMVAQILGEVGVAPSRLAIEITESSQIENEPEVLRTIRELRALGVELWLDDFGTGFAGLSCLREIEFDFVKIDRSFLHAAITPRGAEIFRSIIELVRSTGCSIIVEGIENDKQRDICIEQDVDLLQGYHLGRPAPVQVLKRAMSSPTNVLRLQR